MHISYDKAVDAMYIRLVEGEHEVRTLPLSPQVNLDIGPNEMLVGIEILDASRVIGKGSLPQVVVDNLPVKAA